MNNLINIGTKLEKIRKIKGFSQDYVAHKLNAICYKSKYY